MHMFYVSQNGNDNHPGSRDLPFKSLNRTVEATHKLFEVMDKTQKYENVTVWLSGGNHAIDQTFSITSEDLLKNGCSVTYKSLPGERAVISGGTKVSGWERDPTNETRNLWKVHVPWLENTRQLFVNGRRATRTRSEAKLSHGWDLLDDQDFEFVHEVEKVRTYQNEFTVYQGYKSRKVDMIHWQNIQDIEFVYDVGWTHSTCPIERITPMEDGVFIKMKMPCFRDLQIKGGVQIGTPSYLENAFELLENCGDWYFDSVQKYLYYIPLEGEDIASAEVIVPTLERLLEIKGTALLPVKNITFENITFEYSTWMKPSNEGFAEVQASLAKDPSEDVLLHGAFIKPEAAIQLEWAEGIIFEGCSFQKLGASAIDIQYGSKHNMISHCEFSDISGSGIQLGGFCLKDAHPDDKREIVSGNVIRNNYIHHIGVEYKGAVGIICGYVSDTLISHNEICHTSYSGISIGWGWGFWDEYSDERYFQKAPAAYPKFHKPTVAERNRIEYNHIHHVMQVLHDGAGIYTLSMQANSLIRGNLIHDNAGFIGKGYERGMMVGNGFSMTDEQRQEVVEIQGFPGGIYQDEASGGFEISENIVYNVVLPYNYHDVGMNGRFSTNSFHNNYWGLGPDEEGFPSELAFRAGIEK